MKSSITKQFAVLVLGLMIGFASFAQSTVDDYKIIFKFNTVKQADNTRLLKVSFIGQNKEDRKDQVPVYEAEIAFYNVLDSIEKKLGVAKTDKDGLAELILPENQKYLLDDAGFINLKAVFKGKEDLASKSRELAVKDIFIDMELDVVDSVYMVIVTAQTLDSSKAKVPVPEADVILSVGGMLSKYIIAEETLEDGSIEFEFPYDIPGDKNGMINVYLTIDDNDDYGTVVQMKSVDWGTFDNPTEAKTNQLWSEAAPIWMYVVLSILLVGVWANYVYSIYNLVKIKKEGQLADLNSEEKE
jgi:hypothetical protein